MCGVAGVLDPKRRGSHADLMRLAEAMAARLRHRGPDAAGAWADAERGIAMAATRLAIVDPSPAGAQPMISSCGCFVLAYNGEVYNAAELRDELVAQGRAFRGHSDTEALVEGCAVWGVRGMLERLNGMFAFAVWDRAEARLTLARDRIGIKPLYWGRHEGRILFASELKAFRPLPGWPPGLDRDVLAAYARHGHVPAPHSIFRGIHKLMPGTLVDLGSDGEATTHVYWSLAEAVARGRADPLDVSDAEALAALEALLGDAVARHMASDVPLGAFLSGGIDSSTVAALMQTVSPKPVRSFTIGFHERSHDEAADARAVAAYLGTDHAEHYATPQEAQAVIPLLPAIYDEPFADSSQIPTFLISRMTRDHVTVALSGDGGDELFAGYNRYAQADLFARGVARLPAGLRRACARVIRAMSPKTWDGIFSLLPGGAGPRLAGDKMHKLADVLPLSDQAFYPRLVSQWERPQDIVPGAREPRGAIWDPGTRALVPEPARRLQYLDMLTYLPDDILTKVDRASMAVSLEVRVPLLDHRVVEFAWRLPDRFHRRGRVSKWLLRQLLHRYVPPELVERPKMGFAVPLDAWLRGPLRAWAEALLAEGTLAEDGLLNPAPIRARWAEHLSGRRNWQEPLWGILMLQAWRAAEKAKV